MGKKKRSTDLLSRALEKAPVARTVGCERDATQRTPRARPVGEILEALQGQTLAALSGPFFDERATTEVAPVRKRMRSESGAVQVSAKRRAPAIEATVTIDVRCDQDERGDAGRYQVQALGNLKRESERGAVTSEFPVTIEVSKDDGGLSLVSDEMQDQIAEAIRATGTPS